ncbi:related to cytochrome P450 CYP4/CYP19/CYP26 subfamilies [Cephalotrichum gorgonifer]|uniref:Related to cytochrome P450 CYP4/CYP19/CYP26 subfamilies n=1 Tax=Cephalotrichum gorgonifer TaxID=2041049 RepID=A0AAE8MYF9_9PEZI|nr:related to cytochrome P450 CYP4/CYP19/CYP26 subfamilies [Cephalotrichum gorgonifer]
MTGQGGQYVYRLHQKYGPIVRTNADEVDVSYIPAVRGIHSIQSGYLKSPWYTKMTGGATPNVFSTTDVEYHRRHRRLLSMPLSESALKAVEPTVRANASLVVRKIGEEMKKRGAADVWKWFMFYTTDVIGELSFGESFRMLEKGRKNQYIIDLESIAKNGALRVSFPWLHTLSTVLPIPIFRDAEGTLKRMIAYSKQSLQRYKHLVTAEPDNAPITLFRKLFRAGDEGLSDTEILAEARVYLIAGSDTTSNTLTYLVWSVCRNDSILRILTKELAALPPEFDDHMLKSLPYLNQVIDETLRLYSAVPAGLPRLVPTGGAELAGFWLPGGSTVTTQAYTLHRNPEVFPRPEVFDPTRWAQPTRAMKESSMHFGGGSRICIGMHLARMELRLAAALFFLAFPDAKVSSLEGMSDGDMEQMTFHPCA